MSKIHLPCLHRLALVLLAGSCPAAMAQTGPFLFQQGGGAGNVVGIEAEHFSGTISQTPSGQPLHSWTFSTEFAGFSGTGAMDSTPNSGAAVNEPAFTNQSPRLDYRINFVTSGIHFVWIRGYGRTGSDDSIHIGIDGAAPTNYSWRVTGWGTSWSWQRNSSATPARVFVPSAGEHVFNIWMREDATLVDKIVLTTDAAFTPSGTGPAESASSGIYSSARIEITQQPADVSANENSTATFIVQARAFSDTTPIPEGHLSYQWKKNGADIPGANASTLTVSPAVVPDNGAQFSVAVSVPGASTTSRSARLTVISDTTPPVLVSASGNQFLNSIVLAFNEPLSQTTAINPANYTVSGGVTVSSARLSPDGRKVALSTSPQSAGTIYTVNVSGVTDQAAVGNPVASGASASFTAWVLVNGLVLREFYGTGGGVLVSDLTNHAKYPDFPDSVTAVNLFETPVDSANNYGVRLSGYVIPPETGNYIFYVSADDQGFLYLSTDENPNNKRLIATEPTWNGSRQWLVTSRRNATNPENRSTNIALQAGQRYYIEALMKEAGGGDNLAVTWRLPSQTNPPANGSAPLSGATIATFLNPDIGVPSTAQPTVISATTSGSTNKIFVSFSEPVSDATAANAANYSVNNGVTVTSAVKTSPNSVELTTSPLALRTAYLLTINGIQDLASPPNTIAPNTQVNVSLAGLPADFGQIVGGYQDDFNGTTLAPGWVVRGQNVYSVNNGLLSIATASGDPNHLLYEALGYDFTRQEVLARIRVNNFGTGDGERGGLSAAVASGNSQGINYNFRDEGTLGRHTEFLDDARAWGPELNFKWQNNVWYWMRLKQEPNTATGQADLFSKIWPADGVASEPSTWLSTWDRYPAATVRAGFAGLSASSASGAGGFDQFVVAELDVDYILIKAPGLPNTIAGGSALTGPRQALLVTGAPSASDLAISNRLVQLGYTVTVVRDTASQTSDASGKHIILVSSTVGSGNLLSGGIHKFRDVTIPVINWESANYDDLHMTSTTASDLGTVAGQTNINLVNPNHPLAAGLPEGTNTLYTAAQAIAFAVPNAGAMVIARPIGNNVRAVLFAYETGDPLFGGLTAAGPRLGLPLDNNSAVAATPAGIAIFDAAVRWADPLDPAVVLANSPTNATAVENTPVTFRVEAAGGRPLSYQWFKNGLVITGAVSRTLTFTPKATDNNAQITVAISNSRNSVTSGAAVLTVIAETNAPTLVSASPRGSLNNVLVTFSEAVTSASGTNVANFTIDNGVTVQSAALSGNAVLLATSPLTEGVVYTLTVRDVQDTATTPNTINPNPSTASFGPGQGFIERRFFQFASDPGNLGGLTNNARFPNDPTSVDYPTAFEYPPNGGNEGGINYGDFFLGYIHPPITGDYVFYVSGDDQINLFLSTDESPNNKRLIAFEPQWNNARQWVVTTRRNATNPENRSVSIPLEATKKYYVEVTHREGGGGDSVGVLWQLPGAPAPTNGQPPIPGRFLSTVKATGQPVTIVRQPANQSANEPSGATFSVGVDGTPPFFFQWSTNGIVVPGATGGSFTIPSTVPAQNNTTVAVTVSNFFSRVTSSNAVLTVISDSVPPELVSATGSASFTNVLLTFSENIVPASATNPANYSVSGLTVTGVRVSPNNRNVALFTSPQTTGTVYTVTASGIRDTSAAGNPMPSRQANFTSWVLSRGFLLREVYAGFGGVLVADLTNNAKFPTLPDLVTHVPEFQVPIDSADNYGVRVSGFVTPDESGAHILYIAADDQGHLYLSTDENPNNKRLIATEPTWNGPRQWLVTSRRNAANPENRSTNTLQAGTRYYVEALMKEGGGGDNLAVTWKAPSQPAVTNGSPALPSRFLSSFGSPDGAVITIVQQPFNTTANATATFSVSARAATASNPNQPIFYQWQRDGVDIPGANSSTLTVTGITTADTNAVFRALLSIPGRMVLSSGARINFGPPLVAVNDTLETIQDQPVSVDVRKLLANDLGDTPAFSTVSSPSARGGTLSVAGNSLTYTPAAGISGSDSFNYTITDRFGSSAIGTVNVTVRPANQPSFNLVSVTPQPNGQAIVRFAGIPGRNYTVQASQDLVSWINLGTTRATLIGLIEITDTNAANFNQRFYRTVSP